MEVKRIKQLTHQFVNAIKGDTVYSQLYKWESFQTFGKHWDIDAPDFGKMYDASFQNDKSRRLWKRENWYPKEMMLKLIEIDQEFVRRMFKRLFDEDKSIEARVSQFKFSADEILVDFKKENKTSIETNHFHEKLNMPFLYLSFRYPDIYTLFDYKPFEITCKAIRVTKIPESYNVDRFVKISKIMNTFLMKEDMDESLETRNQHLGIDQNSNYLLVDEFYEWCFNNAESTFA